MRQRRHVNGSSNAAASVSVDLEPTGWGSGRTVPVDSSSFSKRLLRGSSANNAPEPPAVAQKKIATQEKRCGSATARLSQVSGGPFVAATGGHRTKRCVQSARGTSEDRSRPSEDATLSFLAPQGVPSQSASDKSLPAIPCVVDHNHSYSSSGISKTRVNPVLQRSASRGPKHIASGTDANSEVQWAVKVTRAIQSVEAEAVSATPDSSGEPTEMAEFRRMLQDRYGEKRSVRQAFLTWDTNKDGHLNVSELQEMLTRLGLAHTLGREKVDIIVKYVSATPTSTLCYRDFCNLIYGAPELTFNSNANICKRGSSNSSVDDTAVPESEPDSVISLLRAKYQSHKVSQVFRDWDIDKNGGVTMEELETNLRRQGFRVSKPHLTKLFELHDLNHDGRLLYDEFIRLVYGPVREERHSYLADQRRKRQQELRTSAIGGDPLGFFRNTSLPHEMSYDTGDPGFRATLQRKLRAFSSRLNDAYAAFDDDHNGNLSYGELCRGLKELGINLTEREFLHLATYVDTDGDGEISFKEFCDVFGGDGASIRRQGRISKPEKDELLETRNTTAANGSQRRQAEGTFDFSHLARRTKIPTRCGRTPYNTTKGLISGNQEEATRFTTESQLYGGTLNPISAPAAMADNALGQEEKQRRNAANTNRLQRLRTQIERYEAKTQPEHDGFLIAQERRTRTLRRHQERYHQRIEEQQPRQARMGIQITCTSTTPQ